MKGEYFVTVLATATLGIISITTGLDCFNNYRIGSLLLIAIGGFLGIISIVTLIILIQALSSSVLCRGNRRN